MNGDAFAILFLRGGKLAPAERKRIMFDMDSIGRRISELRKAKNMTQMELADEMNISFQAVSNWERGNSMPDISKLPELARILEVSIDELLGKKSELLKSVVESRAKEYLQSNEVKKEEFAQIAPILKPEQVDEIFEGAKPPLDLSEIDDVLPFISRKLIDEMLKKYAADGNRKVLDSLLPFASREMIGELAASGYECGGIQEIEDFLPFVPKEILMIISEKEYEKHGLRNFESIAPFLNRDFLSELARKAVEKDGIKAISPIAPFLSREILSQYIREKYL
jgi:transcriptional regulator with XRE-family HTH domain